jgi:drug/metabolite transporter (DMT)-like permease
MEYIYLVASLAIFSLQFVFVKGYQSRSGNTVNTALSFLLTSSGVMAVFMLVTGGFKLTFSPATVILGVSFGILSVAVNIAQIKALGLGSGSIVTMFILLGGVFLPFGYGIFALKEPLTIAKGLAVIMLCLAFLPYLLANRGEKAGKSGVLFFVLCIVCFVANGIVTVFAKIQGGLKNAGSISEFMFFASVAVIVTVLIIKLFYKSADPAVKIFDVRNLLFGSGYAVSNGLGNLFSMMAAATLESSFQYPFLSGGVLVLSALFFALFFHEKLRKRNYISMAFAVASILLMML